MAVSTLTSTVFDNLPLKTVHAGNVTIGGRFAVGASSGGTVGDIIFLAKIPHGAIVNDIVVDTVTAETAMGVDFGLATGTAAGGGASLSCFCSATTKGTVTRITAAGGQNVRVSVSDSDPNRYGIFAAKLASGTTTASYAINFSITYRCDE